MTREAFTGWRDRRAWCAVLLLLFASYLALPVESLIYPPLAHAFHVHRSAPRTLGQKSYGLEMVIRLLWASLLWLGVCVLLRTPPQGFPLRDARPLRFLLGGLSTGLFVMLATILGIWGLRAASISLSGQSFLAALGNGFSWLGLDFLGALGEEILGRAVILVVAERFLGLLGAVLVSGIMFSGSHFNNPGASRVWLLRLFLQGAVLAYAIFRTRSIWWSVGYHTGWNWISAPLFGAAGSGYLDEGHVFNFLPHGSTWITGGSVGPEGSLLAFIAVLAALGLLAAATRSRFARRANAIPKRGFQTSTQD